MTTEELLQEIKARLALRYGNRLSEVVLFGSTARGDNRPDSDLDVLVVLAGPLDLGREIHTVVEAVYPLILETGRDIDALPCSADDYQAGEYHFYREVRREGIPL
jgi:predicted nucleotidyltransferase